MASAETNASHRRLAAVMFLDMVRYSALMAKNESQALANLKDLKKILLATASHFEGRIVKSLGDGFLVEFPTAITAVSCAKQILSALHTRNHVRPSREHIDARIAIQLGDVVEEKGDLFGDAVNIAARLQSICDPNAIIMTEMVYVQVCNQIVLKGTFTPPRKLKNIPNRLRVFQTAPEGVDLTLWTLKKQGWVAATVLFLLVAGVLSTGAILFKQHLDANRLRMGLLYIRPVRPGAQGMARNMEDEINMKFASLKKVRWVERAALLEMFHKAGIEDVTKTKELEQKAFSVEKDSGLQYALYGGVEKVAKNRWRLTLKIVDTQSMAVVKVLTCSGEDAPSVVALMQVKAQNWLKSGE
ncbi:MAG TPA: adenylate/guanylate cyclase domain-containing protein [bacterium]|nr:adenylate/guanylate cyclase domain-containing protein [bacterium]